LNRYQSRYAKGAYLKGEYPKLIEDRVAAIRKRYGLNRNIRSSADQEPLPAPQLMLF